MDIRTISRTAGAAALVIGPVASSIPIVVTDSENGTAAEQLADPDTLVLPQAGEVLYRLR